MYICEYIKTFYCKDWSYVKCVMLVHNSYKSMYICGYIETCSISNKFYPPESKS